jgi:hypothetical protein
MSDIQREPPPLIPPPPPDLKAAREHLGRVAYAAYSEHRGGRAHDGSPIPGWDAMREEIREGWRVAAWAVRAELATPPATTGDAPDPQGA